MVNLCVMDPSFWNIAAADTGANIVLVLMEEASDLSPQYARLQQVTHRTCGIEKLALQLCRDRIPLQDDGCTKAAKDMLFNGGDRLTLAGASGNAFQMAVLRTNNFVEIVREPLLILGQLGEVLYCLLKATDFARNLGTFKRFFAFRSFRTKLLCGEH